MTASRSSSSSSIYVSNTSKCNDDNDKYKTNDNNENGNSENDNNENDNNENGNSETDNNENDNNETDNNDDHYQKYPCVCFSVLAVKHFE